MRLLSPFRISLVIPTYHPGEEFMRLLERIRQQTILPDEILIINTEEAYFSVPEGSLPAGTRVIHITKQEFDHGGPDSALRGRRARYRDHHLCPSFQTEKGDRQRHFRCLTERPGTDEDPFRYTG